MIAYQSFPFVRRKTIQNALLDFSIQPYIYANI